MKTIWNNIILPLISFYIGLSVIMGLGLGLTFGLAGKRCNRSFDQNYEKVFPSHGAFVCLGDWLMRED